MLADIKGVAGPTEEELQEDGDKGDGLESRSKDLRAERVYAQHPTPLPAGTGWLVPAALATRSYST